MRRNKEKTYNLKNRKEISYLKRAAEITKIIYSDIAKRIKPGRREKEIANELEGIIKRMGLRRSFRTIIASGPNSAKPHAAVSPRLIRENDAVVVDFGIIYKGYHSDMTRTILMKNVNSNIRKLYKTVSDAQKLAIKRACAGMRISELASCAHTLIRKRGLGKYILHSLGHGVGKKIHEAPKISEKNRRRLKKDIVITIEPGLYVKGVGGVRIEDMVLVTANGTKVLTK
ncbi:MAG: M24 family metallopeptidase [Candidatus Omnitrophica bacterium]|nr:M24 family metallopeptidase [Candidatus Omnitrophota bacterium]